MSRKRQNLVTVGLISLGCPKNTVDSERMLAEIAGAGHVIETEPDNADVVVINTCGFIAPARAEAIDVIEQALEWKAEGRVRKVIVAGCLPERLGRRLLDEVEGVDAVMGLGQRDNVVEIINRTLSAQEPALYLEDYAGKCSDDRGRLLTTAGHWAYLRISEGCDHRCSFCTIPSIRGPFSSKTPDMVRAEAEELVSAGVVE